MSAPRPRVAVVRGAVLNPFEITTYAAVQDEFDVVAVGTAPAEPMPVPVHEVRSVGDTLGRYARSAARRLPTRAMARVGGLDRLRGLDSALAGADLIHAADTAIPFTAQAADIALGQRVPLVITAWENIPFLHEDDAATSARKARVRDQAAAFVAASTGARDALVAEGVDADRIRVIPPAVDVDRLAATEPSSTLRSSWGAGPDDVVILYVGRVIREKGVVELLRAFATLDQALPVRLVILGDGEELARVRAAAGLLGVRNRVHLGGRIPHTVVAESMASADIVAVPSLSTPYWLEQFGLVLAEALSCGKPILTTRTGAIPEVVGDAAELVPDYDPEALAAALDGLVRDADRRASLGERAILRARATYSPQVIGPQLAAVYRNVLA